MWPGTRDRVELRYRPTAVIGLIESGAQNLTFESTGTRNQANMPTGTRWLRAFVVQQ